MLTKRTAIVLAICFLLVLPTAAFAKTPQMLVINIHNQTGGDALASITDASGATTFLTFAPGSYNVELPEGRYSYYVSTMCGAKAGRWNMNQSKDLWLNCKDEAPFVALTRNKAACADYGVYVWFKGDFMSRTFWNDQYGTFNEWVDFLGLHGYDYSLGCLDTFNVWGSYYTWAPS